MTPEEVEIVAVRRSPGASSGETAVVRVLGLLPFDWVCAPCAERNRITLLVRLDGTGGREAVRAAVARAFQDRGLAGWRCLG